MSNERKQESRKVGKPTLRCFGGGESGKGTFLSKSLLLLLINNYINIYGIYYLCIPTFTGSDALMSAFLLSYFLHFSDGRCLQLKNKS